MAKKPIDILKDPFKKWAGTTAKDEVDLSKSFNVKDAMATEKETISTSKNIDKLRKDLLKNSGAFLKVSNQLLLNDKQILKEAQETRRAIKSLKSSGGGYGGSYVLMMLGRTLSAVGTQFYKLQTRLSRVADLLNPANLSRKLVGALGSYVKNTWLFKTGSRMLDAIKELSPSSLKRRLIGAFKESALYRAGAKLTSALTDVKGLVGGALKGVKNFFFGSVDSKILKVLRANLAANERFNTRLLAIARGKFRQSGGGLFGGGMGGAGGAGFPRIGLPKIGLPKVGLPRVGLPGPRSTPGTGAGGGWWNKAKAGAGRVASAAARLAGPAIVGYAAYEGLKLTRENIDKIEADPNNPSWKDSPVAQVARGEAKSRAEAGEKNRQRALKILQPGTAKEYLAAGTDKDGKYLDGYTKEELTAMAAGKKPPEATPIKPMTLSTAGAGRGSINPDLPTGAPSMSAGAGRGNVNPSMAPPDTATATSVSTGTTIKPGSQIEQIGGLITDGIGKYFSKSAGVDTDGLNPSMQSNIYKMGKEYTEATGKKINFNSANRDNDKQAQLYATLPKGQAAPPGRSLHNFGLAFDIPSSTANELDSLGLLSKYGFERPIAKEKWHVQPKGMSLAAAKAGIYSADAPTDQSGNTAVAKNTQAPSVTSPMYEPSVASSTPSYSGTTTGSSGGSTTLGFAGLGVKSIPTLDSSDGTFLALNLNVL